MLHAAGSWGRTPESLEKTQSLVFSLVPDSKFLQLPVGSVDVRTTISRRALRSGGQIIFLSLTYWLWRYSLESVIYTEDLSATLLVPLGRNGAGGCGEGQDKIPLELKC